MNPVVAYAIEHQAAARGIIVQHSFRGDDVDEIAQMVLYRIWKADPQEIKYPASYWHRCVLRSMAQHVRERDRIRKLQGISLEKNVPDRQISPRDPQDEPERIACERETAYEFWHLLSELATPAEKWAIIHRLRNPGQVQPPNVRVYLCRLKKKYRARRAAAVA